MRQDDHYAVLIAKIEEVLGLPLSELANMIGVSRSSFYSWAKGERLPTLAHRKAINNFANHIGIDINADFLEAFSNLKLEDKRIVIRMIESLLIKEGQEAKKS